MDLDEYIFEKVAKYFQRRSKISAEMNSCRVTLEEIRPRLTLMARAFTGLPIEVFPAEREGGYKEYNFFLPSSVTLFTTADENLSFYFYRVVYLAVQQQLGT
jgi:nitric oxide reductase NorD protein